MVKSNNPPLSLRTRISGAFLFAIIPTLVLLAIGIELLLIPWIKKSAIDELANTTRVLTKSIHAGAAVAIRNHLRAVAERNREIAQHFFTLVEKGVMTREDAISQLKSIFISQKVGTSGYLYCLDSKGNLPVHPVDEVEGTSVASFNFARQQMKLKEGYVEYFWKNPGEKKERAKALYMVYFAPLDWIISVSSYREEFNELVDPEDFRAAVLSLRFGETGYAYIIDEKGRVIVHPSLPKGYDALNSPLMPTDFVQRMINTESGFLEYEWKNPDELIPRKKMAVYDNLREYGFIVASSSYVNEVLKPVLFARYIAYGSVAFLLLAMGFAVYFMSGRLTRPIDAMINQLDMNAGNGVHTPLPLGGSSEMVRLACDFNRYMADIDNRNALIRNEREQYRSLFEASPDAVLLIHDLVILDCSRASERIFGMGKNELIGKTILDISPEYQTDGSRSDVLAQKIIDKNTQDIFLTFEWIHQRKDGATFISEVRLSPFADSNGKSTQICFVRDVTEHKIADSQLKFERDFSRELIDKSPAYVAILDSSNKIALANPAFCNALGYETGEVEGLNFIVAGASASELSRLQGMLDRLHKAAEENINLTQSGAFSPPCWGERKLVVHWSMNCISDRSGQRDSVFVVGLDITDEQALQEQLNHAQKLEAIGRLAGGVAHDFNNMLGGISGAAELLELKTQQDDSRMEYIKLILNTVDRAAKLSQGLLSFSRKGKCVSTPIDLHLLINEALNIFRSGLDPRIEIISELSAKDSMIVGDSSQLQNLFLNMFINSRDAMENNGTLRVATSNIYLDAQAVAESGFGLEAGQFIEIIISDTGCGIRHDILQKIFEPFFTTKDEGKGTGLGLASAYGAIKDHNGDIRVESQEGVGTTFLIRIPCTDFNNSFSNETDIKSHMLGAGNILLVDDDEILRTTGTLLLREIGYNVLTAADGREGVEVFEKHKDEIDVVLLDMVMPDMNGQDAFYAMRKIAPDAKILLASGFSAKGSVHELEKDGLLGFVSKPYKIAELSKLLKDILS